MKLLLCQCVLCTPCTMSCHFMQSQACRVHVCLAVTCHLHFWQNDWDLLDAPAVARGWSRYQNNSIESWPWRRKLSRRSCTDSNKLPFDHECGTLTTELHPPPPSQLATEQVLQPVTRNINFQRRFHCVLQYLWQHVCVCLRAVLHIQLTCNLLRV